MPGERTAADATALRTGVEDCTGGGEGEKREGQEQEQEQAPVESCSCPGDREIACCILVTMMFARCMNQMTSR